jgi:hypothetical protein
MLQQSFPSVKFIKWAYALIEYDLIYKSLRAMISEVIADFIVAHRIKDDSHINYVAQENFVLMDRFVEMDKASVMFLFHLTM